VYLPRVEHSLDLLPGWAMEGLNWETEGNVLHLRWYHRGGHRRCA
jgi:hypothetical protein